nr:serine/threonine-protein kinase [Kofleriaceae bacterium]
MRATTRATTEPWHPAARARVRAGWRVRNDNGDDARPSDADIPPLPPPPLPFADTQLAPPAPRFGAYLVHDKLGDGGLSIVHRATAAHAERLGVAKPLALKRLRAGFAAEWELVEAFLREAQIGHQLRHVNVARTYDYGRHDGTYYAATELVRGPSLAHVVAQCHSAAGAMPTPVAVEIVLQILDALDHLHTATPAIIHRDVTPTNFLVTAAGRVKLVDLGVAKTAARRQTARGILKGTAAYMAPEYLGGELDARADLFGAGVILHELLSGRALFAADSDVQTMRNVRRKIIQRPSRWAAEVPFDLDDIVLLALQRDPARRWQSASAMRFALTTLATRLGGRDACQHAVREWLAWAFARAPRHDTSAVQRLVASLADEDRHIARAHRAP